MAGRIEARLKELGIKLPTPPSPVAIYVPFVISGKMVYLSGNGPAIDGKLKHKGKVGRDVTIEQAIEAARDVGLNLLAHLRNACDGDLDRVKRLVKVLGMVNAMPDFEDQPKVINGCSNLFHQVFGDAGKGARSAVGMGSLPGSIPVEIEAIFELN
jgi:enamine deaminase RidA (YjgF/YER057c/UK114 family)